MFGVPEYNKKPYSRVDVESRYSKIGKSILEEIVCDRSVHNPCTPSYAQICTELLLIVKRSSDANSAVYPTTTLIITSVGEYDTLCFEHIQRLSGILTAGG
jgi:hypothetical protein